MGIKGEKGFSLLQVVISATILSLISSVFANLILSQKKHSIYLEDQVERMQLVRNFETILGDVNSCGQSLNGILIRNQNERVSLARLSDQGGSSIFQSNSQINNLTIGQIEIENKTVLGPNSAGFVDVIIPITRVRSGGGAKQFRNSVIKLNVIVDAAKRVVGCQNENFSCRQVVHRGGPPHFVSAAVCAFGEKLMGSGGRCELPGANICLGANNVTGVMHVLNPDFVNNTVEVDCYAMDGSGESCSEAIALCCR